MTKIIKNNNATVTFSNMEEITLQQGFIFPAFMFSSHRK